MKKKRVVKYGLINESAAEKLRYGLSLSPTERYRVMLSLVALLPGSKKKVLRHLRSRRSSKAIQVLKRPSR